MKNKNLFRRISAVILCLALVTAAGFTGLVSSAAESDGAVGDTYKYNLTPYSDSLGDSFITSWSHETDYRTNLKFTDLFCNGWNGYTSRSGSSFPYRTDNAGETYSRVAGLTPVDENRNPLEFKDFELTFNYRVPLDTAKSCGAIWIGFRQKEAGHFFSGFNKYYTEQSAVRVTNTGITIASGSDLNKAVATEDAAMSAENTAWLAKDNSFVTIKVKVAANYCEVGVYKTESMEKLLTYSEFLDTTNLYKGYVTLGIGDRQLHMISLEVKEITDAKEVEVPKEFDASFQPYAATLADSFLTTWSHESNYKTDIDFNYMFKNGWNNFTVRNYTGDYPFANTNERWSRIAGITPIDENGKAADIRNFELTFDYRVPFSTTNADKVCGAIFVGFRQKEAGHFLTSFATFNQEQSIVKIDNTGISIGSGSNINNTDYYFATHDEASMSSENTAWLAADGSLVTIKVKVVGNNCEVGVYNSSTKEALLTYSEELDPTALQSGYLTLGLGDNEPQMISLNIKRLDESGNVINFTEYTNGDVNGDDSVDIVDLVRIKKYLNGKLTISDIYKKNADCTMDGAIDASDLAELRKILLNL